jgi:hypothetical protein
MSAACENRQQCGKLFSTHDRESDSVSSFHCQMQKVKAKWSLDAIKHPSTKTYAEFALDGRE